MQEQIVEKHCTLFISCCIIAVYCNLYLQFVPTMVTNRGQLECQEVFILKDTQARMLQLRMLGPCVVARFADVYV